MRFHCGISFKPKFNKIKWIIFGLIGLGGLFFSNILIVNASTNVTTNEEHIYWQGRNLTTGQTEAYDWYYWPTYYDQMGQAYQSYEMIRIGALIHYPQSSGTYYVQVKYHTSWIVHDVGCMLWAGDIQNRTCNITKIEYDYNNNESWVTIDYFYESSSDYVELYLTFNDNTNIIVPHDDRIGFEYNSFINNPDGSSIIIGQNNTIINQNDTIINNQTEINESINDVNDTLTEEYDGSAGGHEFDLPNYNYPSTIQGFFNLPIDLLRTIVNNSDTCTPYQINLSSITQRWGGFDYTLTLPCLRAKLQSLLGVIYSVIDSLIAFYLFYNMAMYVLQLIDAITSGTDLFSYLYHGANNNQNTGYGHYNRDTGEVVD